MCNKNVDGFCSSYLHENTFRPDFNPNLCGLLKGSLCGGGRDKTPPSLKLVRIILRKTRNLDHKYTQV